VQAANYVSYSLNYALELDQKQRAHERDVAALREQLAEVKAEFAAAKRAMEAERKNAKAELAAARQATAAEVESAKAAAVQQFLGSKEYTRRVAEQALPAYERGAEEMKRVALRLNPRLDAAKLVLPLD
jgi:peptidoglycan hydrolase CwlO-like protein